MKIFKFYTTHEGEELIVLSENPIFAVNKVELYFKCLFGMKEFYGAVNWSDDGNIGFIFDD